MNYLSYINVDVVNGQGTRCTLFVSGCEHHCKGCYNQKSMNLDAGHLFTEELEQQIIDDLNDTRIKLRGLSLSGGDPLHPSNLEVVNRLISRVKEECQGKDIWLWSGYRIEELNTKQHSVVNMVDVFIDGRFEQTLANPSLKWKGSSNQVIHTISSK